MKIYNVPGVVKAYKQNKINANKNICNVEGKRDAMQVSEEAQLFNKILQNAKNAPEIRERKVNELKTALKQGSYNISADDIAEKLLQGINIDKKI